MLRHHSMSLRIVAAVVLACVAGGAAVEETAADYLVVNSTADPGDGTCDSTECTLREAISSANASPGLDTISFNIAPGGAQTIIPASALPTITDPVVIDGTTQPGFTGRPPITLRGGSAGSAAGLTITAGNSTVRGLVTNRFTNGVLLASDGNIIAGNYIGTSADGTSAEANANGILIDRGDNNRIGGTTPADRNVISGNSVNAILLTADPEEPGAPCSNDIDDDNDGKINDGCSQEGSVSESGAQCDNALNDDPGNDSYVNDGCPPAHDTLGNMVLGNYIGTNAAGTAWINDPEGTSVGLRMLHARATAIGGVATGAGNLMSGVVYSVLMEPAQETTIQGNLFGTDVTGTVALGGGAVFVAGPDNVVGGNSPAARNVITPRGLSINGRVSKGNVVQGNYIGTDITGILPLAAPAGTGAVFLNCSSGNLIGGTGSGEGNVVAFAADAGVTVATWCDGVPGTPIRGNSIHSNGSTGIDYRGAGSSPPTIQQATATSVSGTACAGCEIDVFSDSAGQGRVYHGSAVADGAGNWTSLGSIVGPNATATATNPNQQTSVFSAPVVVPPPENDVDRDGVLNTVDNCPNDPNSGQENLDGDSLGDVCDPDDDNDGVNDGADNCPVVGNSGQQDGDGDGAGNACDNCPATANVDQADLDGDGQGDVCDPDDDGDGVDDSADNCPTVWNSNQANLDGDAMGDVCDPDSDNDDVPNQLDPCPLLQDCDGDGVYDIGDNCPTIANASQQDSDGDAVGDACEPCAIAPAGCIDRLSLDMEDDATPANTPTSVGTREPCRRVENNDLLDADEDFVDALVVDVVVGPVGIPSGEPLMAFDFNVGYDQTKVLIAALDVRQMIGANPGSDIYDLPGDGAPDSDGSLAVFALDTGGVPGETGAGILARIMLESVTQTPGLTTLRLNVNGVVNDGGGGVEIHSVYAAALALDTDCAVPDSDGDGLPDLADNCPTVLNPNQADNENDGVGNVCDRDDDNAGVYDADEMSCGADPFVAAVRPEWTFGSFAGVDDDGDTLVDEALPPGAEDYDCDGDGYKGSAESGAPLCANGANDDDKVGVALVADDAVIDDGCPGGPGQVGAFSEAQFNIGGNDQDPCGLGSWPSDFITGGFPDSTNKINVTDLTSFIAPPELRRLDTAPGQPTFDKRWDLSPGRGVFNNMINVTDLTALIAGASGFPPMLGGVKAFNGASCPWAP